MNEITIKNKKRTFGKALFCIAVLFAAFMSFSCIIVTDCDGSGRMTSASISDDNEIVRVYVDGWSSSFSVDVEVWVDGRYRSSYYIDNQYYNVFDNCIKVEMNRAIPSGATVKISPEKDDSGFSGYIELVAK